MKISQRKKESGYLLRYLVAGLLVTSLHVEAAPALRSTTVQGDFGVERGMKMNAQTQATTQTVYYMIGWMKDGGKVVCPFYDHPTLRKVDGGMELNTDQKTLFLPSDNILKITLARTGDDALTAIEENMVQTTMQQDGDVVYFEGCLPNKPVRVYDMYGRMVMHTHTDAEGKCQITIADQAKGIYVIRTEGFTCKIGKK